MPDYRNEIAIHFDADFLSEFIAMLNRNHLPGPTDLRSAPFTPADPDARLEFSVTETTPGEGELRVSIIRRLTAVGR